MKLLVCGGRTWGVFLPEKPWVTLDRERTALFKTLDNIHAKNEITQIIHGGADGADKCAGLWAELNSVATMVYAVDHALDGPWPAAGPRRNQRMLDAAKPDGVLAMPGGRGTLDMVTRAEKAGVTVWRPYG